MALARSVLFSTVAAELGPIFRLCSQELVASDTPGDLKETIDQVFRALGVQDVDLASATVPTGSEAQAIAYLRYAILSRLILILSLRDPAPGNLAAITELFKASEIRAREFGWLDLNPVAYAGGINELDYDTNQLTENPKFFRSSDVKPTYPYDPEMC